MKQFRKDKIRMYAFLTACLIALILLNSIGVFAEGNNGVTESSDSFGDYWKISGTVNDYEQFQMNYTDKALVSDYISLDSVFHSSDFTNSYWGSVNTNQGGRLLSFLDEGSERRLLANFPNLYIPCVSRLTNSNNYACLRDLGASGGTNHSYQLFIMNTNGSATNCCGDGRYYGIWSLDETAVLLSCTFTVGGEYNGEDVNTIVLNSYYCTSYNFTEGNISTANTEIGVGYKSYYYNNPSYAPTVSFRSICASQWACVFFDYDDFGYEHVPQLPPVNTISGGSGGSGSCGSTNNYLVMDSGDWTFKNSSFTAPYSASYNTGSIYPNGSISFSFLPSDYQIEHKDKYTLTFGFTFDYDVNYKNYGATDYGPFLQTSALLNNKKKFVKKDRNQ